MTPEEKVRDVVAYFGGFENPTSESEEGWCEALRYAANHILERVLDERPTYRILTPRSQP